MLSTGKIGKSRDFCFISKQEEGGACLCPSFPFMTWLWFEGGWGRGLGSGEGEGTDESSSQNGGQAKVCDHIVRVKSVIFLQCGDLKYQF